MLRCSLLRSCSPWPPTAIAQGAADPYAEVLGYKIGQPRTAVMAIEAEVHAATAAQLPAIEDKLLKILQSAEATSDAKDWACRQLRQAGSEKSAAALAGLLGDKQLDTVARWRCKAFPERRSMRSCARAGQGARRIQGRRAADDRARRDRGAVAVIAALAGDPNPAVAEAALFALGQIGGSEALAAIRQANVPPAVTRYRWHAMLLCAEQLAAADEAAEAAKIYRDVFAETSDVVIRTGALRGVLLAEKVQAADLAAAALKDPHPKLRLAAAKLVCETGCPKLLGAVLSGLSALPADSAAALLDLVNDPVALPSVLAAAASGDEAIRTAALARWAASATRRASRCCWGSPPAAAARSKPQPGKASSVCAVQKSMQRRPQRRNAASYRCGPNPSGPWRRATPYRPCRC